jgi:hypothetical protein
METAIISPEFQVDIQQAIREALGIQPGQKVQIILGSWPNGIKLSSNTLLYQGFACLSA